MTFMMTSSNDDKSGTCQFSYQDLFQKLSIQYCTKFHVKWPKIPETQHVFSPQAY